MIELGFDFERRLNDMLRSSIAAQSIKAITLGGVTGPSGGVGSPIGGYIGQLSQVYITYDTSEDAIDTPFPLPSGVSLVTNLNKIRYDISQIDSRVTILETDITNLEERITVTESGINSLDSRVTVLEETNYVETFLDLSDTPITYSGNVGKYVRVSSGNALEFSEIPSGEFITVFTELIDTPSSYSGQSGKVVIVNEGETGLEFSTISLSGTGADSFVELLDVPNSYLGQAGKTIIVSSGEDSLVFTDFPETSGSVNTLLELIDTPSSYSGQSGKYLVVSSGEDSIEFIDLSTQSGVSSFVELDDVPQDYTGQAGKAVIVNYDESGLAFTTISGIQNRQNDYFYYLDGALYPYNNIATFIIPRPCTISAVYMYCKEIGISGETIIDVNINDTTIFTTQSNRPSLPYTSSSGTLAIGYPDSGLVSSVSRLSFDIDQVATESSGLSICVVMAD